MKNLLNHPSNNVITTCASRTIETVLVTNTKTNKLFYIYNYEDWFYRVFNNLIDLNNIFDDAFEPVIWFDA